MDRHEEAEEVLVDELAFALVDTLPEEHLSELKRVLAAGDAEALDRFFEARVPDLKSVIRRAVDIARAELGTIPAYVR